MRVIIQFRGPLAKQLKEGKIEIECIDGCSLTEVLTKALERDDVREIWTSPEVMDRDALILCNESDIGLTGGLETRLSDGDVLVVLPLIHGG